MKTNDSIKNVLVAVNLAEASWRDFLSGFFDFARHDAHWNIKLIQSAGELSEIIGDGQSLPKIDGIVSGIRADNATASVFNKTQTPIVLVGTDDERLRKPPNKLVVIRNDNEDIGAFAARHFLSLGSFSSFGFVTTPDNAPWARLRGIGCQRVAEANGLPFHFFKSPFPAGSERDLGRLARWLRELPKPAAVLAAYDRRAIDVLAVCGESKLSVPGQVAVIGVDNDRLLCDFSEPPLSSVAPDHENEGLVAARTLDAMMRKRFCARLGRMLITGKRIVERESTAPISLAAALVRRASNLIVRSASKNIKAVDVADSLRVSRSLLDIRFKSIRGTTVSAFIAETRLSEVKRQLRKTSHSIRSISRECGFSSPNHLKNIFKRHFGISMREYRMGKKAPSELPTHPRI